MLYLHSESKATFFRQMLRCIVCGPDECGGNKAFSLLSQCSRGSLGSEGDERTKGRHCDLHNPTTLKKTGCTALPFSKEALDSTAFVAATETVEYLNRSAYQLADSGNHHLSIGRNATLQGVAAQGEVNSAEAQEDTLEEQLPSTINNKNRCSLSKHINQILK